MNKFQYSIKLEQCHIILQNLSSTHYDNFQIEVFVGLKDSVNA